MVAEEHLRSGLTIVRAWKRAKDDRRGNTQSRQTIYRLRVKRLILLKIISQLPRGVGRDEPLML